MSNNQERTRKGMIAMAIAALSTISWEMIENAFRSVISAAMITIDLDPVYEGLEKIQSLVARVRTTLDKRAAELGDARARVVTNKAPAREMNPRPTPTTVPKAVTEKVEERHVSTPTELLERFRKVLSYQLVPDDDPREYWGAVRQRVLEFFSQPGLVVELSDWELFFGKMKENSYTLPPQCDAFFYANSSPAYLQSSLRRGREEWDLPINGRNYQPTRAAGWRTGSVGSHGP